MKGKVRSYLFGRKPSNFTNKLRKAIKRYYQHATHVLFAWYFLVKIWAVFNTVWFNFVPVMLKRPYIYYYTYIYIYIYIYICTIILGYLALSFVELLLFTSCFTFIIQTCYSMLHTFCKYIHKNPQKKCTCYTCYNLFIK